MPKSQHRSRYSLTRLGELLRGALDNICNPGAKDSEAEFGRARRDRAALINIWTGQGLFLAHISSQQAYLFVYTGKRTKRIFRCSTWQRSAYNAGYGGGSHPCTAPELPVSVDQLRG